MKKFTITLLAILMVLTLTACGNKAEAAVKTFMENCKAGKLEEINKYEQQEVTSDEYQQFYVNLFKNLEYTIEKSESKSSDEAIVTVTITNIDMSSAFTTLFSDYIQWALGKVLSGQEVSDQEASDKMMETLNNLIETNKGKTKTTTVDITVIKEDGKWNVKLDEKLFDAITGGFISSIANFDLDY